MTGPVTVYILSAFAAGPGGGNPAGVVPDAAGLNSDRMQAIARHLALSETAFVLPGRRTDRRLRFFTPTAEVDLCGHATVAAWALLHQLGRVTPGRYHQELAAGTLEVEVRADGLVGMEQPRPAFGRRFDVAGVADLLGLAPTDLAVPGLPIQAVSTGLADILVPVRSRARLAAIRPDFPRLADFNAASATVGVHAFCLEPDAGEAAARCRNFAPRYGIPEESATGSAAGALACYLHRYRPGRRRFLFEQGRELGRPSRIFVELETAGADIRRVVVSGYGRQLETRRVES